MSIHPNAILQFSLTPDDLSRKTFRGIVDKYCEGEYESPGFDIGKGNFHIHIMEEEDGYNRGYQIKGKEGDILIFDHITYGYGETILWDDLIKLKEEAEIVIKKICEEFNCSYEVF